MKLTYQCSGDCVYCEHRKKIWRNKNPKEMSRSLINRLFAKLTEENSLPFQEIHLTGGEPSLSKHISIVLEKCAELKIPATITTSGWQSNSTPLRSLLEAGLLKGVCVSIDSSSAYSNDLIRGAGSFARAVRSLEEAIFVRGSGGNPEVTVVTVVHHGNIRELGKTVRFLYKLGVDRWMPAYLESTQNFPELAPTHSDLHWLKQERKNDRFLDEILHNAFTPLGIPICLITDGFVSENAIRKCTTKGRLLILHPSGDLHSCYGSEHHLTRPVANINADVPTFSRLLRESAAVWLPCCQNCPEPYQQSLDFRKKG